MTDKTVYTIEGAESWKDTTQNPDTCNHCGKRMKMGAPGRYLTQRDAFMIETHFYVFCVKCHAKLLRAAKRRKVNYQQWVKEHMGRVDL